MSVCHTHVHTSTYTMLRGLAMAFYYYKHNDHITGYRSTFKPLKIVNIFSHTYSQVGMLFNNLGFLVSNHHPPLPRHYVWNFKKTKRYQVKKKWSENVDLLWQNLGPSQRKKNWAKKRKPMAFKFIVHWSVSFPRSASWCLCVIVSFHIKD